MNEALIQEKRLISVEMQVNHLTERVEELQEQVRTLTKSMSVMQRVVDRTFWLAVGGGVFFVVSQVGLVEVLKRTIL